MNLPEHMSYSQFRMYHGCPAQYYWKYVSGELEQGFVYALNLGKLYHRVLENTLGAMAGVRPALGLGFKDAILYHYKALAEDEGFDPEEHEMDMTTEVVPLLKAYYNSVLPTVQPVDVEKVFEVEVPGMSVPFKGVIDVVEADGFLTDHKTSKNSWSSWRVKKDWQATAYTYGMWRLDGLIHPFRFDIALKRTGKIQRLATSRTKQQLQWFERAIRETRQSMERGIFHPNPLYMYCGDFCEAWELCMIRGLRAGD